MYQFCYFLDFMLNLDFIYFFLLFQDYNFYFMLNYICFYFLFLGKAIFNKNTHHHNHIIYHWMGSRIISTVGCDHFKSSLWIWLIFVQSVYYAVFQLVFLDFNLCVEVDSWLNNKTHAWFNQRLPFQLSFLPGYLFL